MSQYSIFNHISLSYNLFQNIPKGNVLSMLRHHALKAYDGVKIKLRPLLSLAVTEVSGLPHAPVTLSLGLKFPVAIGQETEWATKSVWT
jgi:hypothetical protein